jgi:hypothetical protein
VSITSQNSIALARRSSLPPANIYVVRQTNHAGNRELEMLGTKNPVSIGLDHFRGSFPDETHRSWDADRSERLIACIQ